ncbi:actin 4 [Pelomyxa schiedti]|nr:actin 4 [Pelomyxa schiedti]
MSSQRVYVADFGSDTTKAGFNVDDETPAVNTEPSFVFPTVVGYEKWATFGGGPVLVAEDAVRKRHAFHQMYPIQRGVITRWDDMGLILRHAFEGTHAVDHPVLIADTPLNTADIREQLMRHVFEGWEFPGAYFANQAVLSLYAAGRTTGLAIESGHGVTSIVPVFEGCAIPHATIRLEFGGSDISECLRRLLNARGYHLKTAAEGDTSLGKTRDPAIVQNLKETHCYVSTAFDSEMESRRSEQTFQLPDDESITVTNEHFRCTEAFFQPSSILSLRTANTETSTSSSQQLDGIHRACMESIQRCHPDIHKQLLNNIVLGGANTLFPGLAPRLSAELHSLITSQPPTSTSATTTTSSYSDSSGNGIQVSGPCTVTSTINQRKYSAWTGGCVMASLDGFLLRLISPEEYEERGPALVHRMCY